MDNESAYRAYRLGRFKEASALLARGPTDAILSLELAYFGGLTSPIRADAKRLMSASRLAADRSRCAQIIASQSRDDGAFDEAIVAAKSAVELASAASDIRLIAWSQALLLETECEKAMFDVARMTALETRRAAMRCGDPAVLAKVHHTFGSLEARAGRFDRAIRHFLMARRSLAESPNAYIEAAVALDESSTRSLMGDLEQGLSLARAAADLAELSGWSKGVVAAAANCAFFCVILGRTGEAEDYLSLAGRQKFSSASYNLALSETRAHMFLAQGRLDEASNLLAEQRGGETGGGPWYRLSVSETKVRILNRQRRWSDAIRTANDALRKCSASSAPPVQASIRLRRATAVGSMGSTVKTSDIPFEEDKADWPISTLGNFWLTRACNSNSSRSPEHARRALRLYQAIGDRSSEVDAALILTSLAHHEEGQPGLDGAVALLELAAYPQILAKEAYALLEATGCVKAAALVARAEQTVRVLETRGWDERRATHAARNDDPAGMIECGIYRDENLQIIADPPDDLEQRCTFITIKKLVATALTLDRYRRDEKQRAALWPAESLDGDPDCIWVAEPISEIVSVARKIAHTPLSVLLTGETGTGKEMLARTIHRASDRAGKIMLPFNCTAVPRDMLESQLFGYRRGAFTGADTSFVGVIRSSEGGTLFLDEIADVPIDVQPKLLRFLETHEIHPLGEAHPIKVDVRVIAATNANLEQLVAQGRFREDLFYRLNVVQIRMPPLRERREEIPALVEHYIRRYGDQQRKGHITLSDEALEYLLLYAWPGNIRQLANEVNRMLAMAEPNATLTSSHLSAEIHATRRTTPATTAPESEMRVRLDQSLPEAVELLERMMVQSALDRSKGRIEEAAKLLGISRKGLFLKRRRWGLPQVS